MAGVEEFRSLGPGYWYRWMAALALGIAGLVVVTLLVRPPNAWLVGLLGTNTLIFLAFGVTSLRLGHQLEAAGYAISVGGWVIWLIAVVEGTIDAWLWQGVAVLALGAIVTIYAEHRHRIRRAIGV